MSTLRPSEEAASAQLRRAFYALLIVTAGASMVGRVSAVKSDSGRSAMLSANDRSRWCTIRALVDHGTYAIDDVIRRGTDWYTIDMVRHRGRDGREHYYSSKPPLLATLLAGKYWLLKSTTGANLTDSPFYVARLTLLLTNVLPLILYFVVLGWIVESLGVTDWGRVFIMTCATWGTFLTTFAVTLNNHLPAAISVLFSGYAALRVIRGGDRQVLWFILSGGFGAFAVSNELPALAWFSMLLVALLWVAPQPTLIGFVPAAAVVAVAFFGTNFLAHGTWRPPYSHRHDGPVLASVPASAVETIAPGRLSAPWRAALAAAGIDVGEQAEASATIVLDRWNLWDPETQNRYALVKTDGGHEVRRWDNWYEYEASYWTPERKTGVDRGEPSRAVYAFHLLAGHHGVFSLTPIWLLSAVGVGIWLGRGERSLRVVALGVLTLTAVCTAFYILRPEEDRNYGGVSCGFRWLFWLTPLWLVCAIPAADAWSKSRLGRGVALALLAASIVSATYASLDPWSHPWIFDYWTNLEWIRY